MISFAVSLSQPSASFFEAYNIDLYGIVKRVLWLQGGFGQWGVLQKKKKKRVESASRDMPLRFLLHRWPPSFHPRADNVPQLEAGGFSQVVVTVFVTTPSPCCPKPRGGAHILCGFSGFPTFFPHLCKLSLGFPTCMCHPLPAGNTVSDSPDASFPSCLLSGPCVDLH